jgi:hypothetical protein
MSSKPLSESEKDQIVRCLLSLRRCGRLQGVWLNAGTLYIREIAVGPPEYLSWKRAAELVGLPEQTVPRKPVAREAFRFTLAKGRRA